VHFTNHLLTYLLTYLDIIYKAAVTHQHTTQTAFTSQNYCTTIFLSSHHHNGVVAVIRYRSTVYQNIQHARYSKLSITLAQGSCVRYRPAAELLGTCVSDSAAAVESCAGLSARLRQCQQAPTLSAQPPDYTTSLAVQLGILFCNINVTRMWANAQPDGRPAKHRWRPLFNAAKFG